MSDELNISLVQPEIIWQNTSENLAHLSRLVQLESDPDIIVLPEMFNTGFSMHPEEIAMPSDGGIVLDWMKEKASEMQSAIIGSVAVKVESSFVNRLYFVKPNGDVLHYDKHHLFRMAGENEHFINGDSKLIVEYKGWKICPLICYDLRFPVWSRNVYKNNTYDYDLLLYVANWPKPRANAWVSLLQARSIENLCYTVGVNRVGEDGNSFEYSGDSRAFNFLGERLDGFESSKESVQRIRIDKESLVKFRKKFPTGLDADKFELI